MEHTCNPSRSLQEKINYMHNPVTIKIGLPRYIDISYKCTLFIAMYTKISNFSVKYLVYVILFDICRGKGSLYEWQTFNYVFGEYIILKHY